jgi:hypothetical protein
MIQVNDETGKTIPEEKEVRRIQKIINGINTAKQNIEKDKPDSYYAMKLYRG